MSGLPQCVLDGLAALGDAVAVIHRGSATLGWTSPAWQVQCVDWPTGTPADRIEASLPGLQAALQAVDDRVPRRLAATSPDWEVQLAALDAGHALLRLVDRREQGQALQRQLADREQLLFTSRVISVGEMAATLAHELNQPIGACANLLRGLRTRLGRRRHALAAEEARALDRAIEQAMFAARVIARIREFTQSHQPRHVRVDLVALLRSCASLLDWDLRRSPVRLGLQLPDRPVVVRGDEVMLQQVVVNLMRNALDALRAGPSPDAQLTLTLQAGADEAEIRVADNGCGLGDEAAARLFVPFASSKPTGMGLGLSICRSFVELHQGRLWFSRPAERGVTFHVGLPLAERRPSAANPTPAEALAT